MKKTLAAILNKFLVKISDPEEYNQQLIKIESSIKDLLASERGKEAKAIFDFISKSPEEDLEKIAILAETVRSIQEKDARTIFDFISKSPKEDLEKIADLARNIRSIQKKDAKVIFEFLNKASKKKLEKIAILAAIASSIPELHEIKIPSESVITYTHIMDTQEIKTHLRILEDRLKEYKDKWCLFSMDADTRLEDDLNNGVISEDLENIFKEKGFLLSDNASVTNEKNGWIIADEEK